MPAGMLCGLQLNQHRETCGTVGRLRQNMLVLLRSTNLWGYAWKGLRARTMKTTSQEQAWIHWVTFILCTKLFLCLKPWKCQKQRQQWRKNVKIGEKTPWQLTKVRNENEVIAEARTKGHTVHFASLMDLCHLKYKGRVVLQGDIVKDDSGSFAVFFLNKDHQLHKWRHQK